MSQLAQVNEYIKQSYGDSPEFLWDDFDNAIWRNQRNRKWYAIVQNPTKRQLHLGSTDERIPIINVRLTPELAATLVDGEKYLPAYHMNKRYWLTIRLDGVIDFGEICDLIDQSYQIIDAKK